MNKCTNDVRSRVRSKSESDGWTIRQEGVDVHMGGPVSDRLQERVD